MHISLIAAIAKNHVIGLRNNIPWKLSADLAWFKSNTLNKPVIMGGITYRSIGKHLPQRLNIIFSQRSLNNNKEVILVKSIDEALVVAGYVQEIMIIGGGKIYELFLPLATRLYLTHIDTKVIGDTYFPTYNLEEWNSLFTERHKADKNNPYNYRFEILERHL